MNLCESCKTGECSFRKDGRLVHACHSFDPITIADISAKDAEIAKLKDEIHSERAHWQDQIVRERNDILDRATNGVLTAIAPLAERPCTGEAHGSGFVLVGRVWHDENEVRKAAESLGLASTGAGPTPDYTGEGSAWVPPVEARAVAVPDLTDEQLRAMLANAAHRCGFVDYEPEDASVGDLEILREVRDDIASLFHAIPADRVLGEGMVAVDREWIEDAVEVAWSACKLIGKQAPIWEEKAKSVIRRDPVRANQGGAAT